MVKKSICLLLMFVACKPKVEKIKPLQASISESVYASGIIKSKDQYQAFVPVSGIVNEIYVRDGDSVKKDAVLLTVMNQSQRLNAENAQLAYDYAAVAANQGKLKEASLNVEFSKNKMKNDSLLFMRQSALWSQSIGTRVELEQRELVYQNSKNNYSSALIHKQDLERQLNFNASQVQKNLLISQQFENDFTLKSGLDGVVYTVLRKKGEMVTPQTPLLVLGSAREFVLEMQVDEYDIMKIKTGMTALISMDSYKGEIFEALITRIDPYMNDRSKTFVVEAVFVHGPAKIYPNITFEASIVLRSKNNALLIPRNFMINDSQVLRSNKDTVTLKTGLRDYLHVEVTGGLGVKDELIKPSK